MTIDMSQGNFTRNIPEIIEGAVKAFHETPMPLSACLKLRRLLSEQQSCPDLLMPIPGKTIGSGEQLTSQKLQSILKGIRLGEWSLDVETIEFLFVDVAKRQPKAILEFGSGVSTIVLAQAMAALYPTASSPVVYSIEQDVSHLNNTIELLEKYQLAKFVKIFHAPLGLQVLDQISTNCCLLPMSELQSFLGNIQIDFLLIDGPAANYGERIGTLLLVQSLLKPGAVVYMDDGLRDSELAITEWWSRYGYLEVEGILWIGKGLMVGRIPHQPLTQCSYAREFLTWIGRESQGEQSNDLLSLPTQFVSQYINENYVENVKGHTGVQVENQIIRSSRNTKARCVFLNTYYPGFLEAHYSKALDLHSRSYQAQKDSLQTEYFGDSNFYSHALIQSGWEAHDLIVNCASLQQAWALEKNIAGQGLEIAVEQIKEIAPDVIYLQDLNLATSAFISAIRPLTKLIVGQIASKVPSQIDLKQFDILFSSFPHFVNEFRKMGISAYYQPLAFDPRVIQEHMQTKRTHDVTFVGSISADHSRRMEFLEQLQGAVAFKCWGYQMSPLTPDSRMYRQYCGEAWGKEMFALLQDSFITLNYHVDVAENYANNMRLFEATGCGALLITDYKENLQDLFDVGREVVAYRSIEEGAELIRFYLHHQDEAKRVAQAGQARTLRDHTYSIRMAQTAEILDRHLRYQRESADLSSSDLSRISYGYETIENSQITVSMKNAWKDQSIPGKQRALVQTELRAMYSGRSPLVFDVLADCLRPYVISNSSILEIGCASGYYYEVLEYLLKKRISYTGVDYSDPLILMAKDYYPSADFYVADGACLPFEDNQFHVAISSCILLHVPEYYEHIRETARVAQNFIVVHRTPVCKQHPTQYFRKYAYGVETVELRFNEKKILEEFFDVGFSLIHALEYASVPDSDHYDVTYVFRKTPQSI